ncbi:DeoR/GlpR family DNA-binding transcription regulator [Parvularcula oceani]|uniref:DeoR/GlpR family DNA-binding transcription regulator n=1 Tax=Parvularcula oceani TaxID=1247963 RepID=UPI0009DFA3B4|nr:DeoR/GlpR family DNA-binding transcription regulator [Parvularcula oceani]
MPQPKNRPESEAVLPAGKSRSRSVGTTSLPIARRRQKILEWLKEEGSARVRDLSEAFGVSEVTIRQDLEFLEKRGDLVREHGGAYLRTLPEQVRTMSLPQHAVNLDAKERIGRMAASRVDDGDVIILDSGSTTSTMTEHLASRQYLTVITNALNIALSLGANPSVSVHMTGGHFKAPTLSLSGEKAAAYLDGLHAQKLFLATAGISFSAGLTYPSIADLPVKRAMIASADYVYLLADSSKVGRMSFSALGGVDMVNTLITDEGLEDKDAKRFEEMGIEVLIA